MRLDRISGVYPLAAAVFFGLIILYAFELNVINRYLEPNRLIAVSLISGAVAGTVLAWRVMRRQKDLYDKIRIGFTTWAAVVAFSPLIISLVNQVSSFGAKDVVPAVFASHEARFTSRFGASARSNLEPNRHIYFFYLGPKLKRITLDKPIWENRSSGDTVSLAVRKGGLGLDWIALPAN